MKQNSLEIFTRNMASISVLSVEPYGMKPAALNVSPLSLLADFSALGRAVWDETTYFLIVKQDATGISVLSVEPYGMKLSIYQTGGLRRFDFSALGRAVWDETSNPMISRRARRCNFSALGRAVWDETLFVRTGGGFSLHISVLSVEPYGMKHHQH